jgi:hypothetical protein
MPATKRRAGITDPMNLSDVIDKIGTIPRIATTATLATIGITGFSENFIFTPIIIIEVKITICLNNYRLDKITATGTDIILRFGHSWLPL